MTTQGTLFAPWVLLAPFAWKQVDGDISPETYGGTFAMCDGRAIELLKIQPVREYVGDREAEEVGFPFWTREAYFDEHDLSPERDDVRSALKCCGIDSDAMAEMTPEQRAVAIACCLLDYGCVDEGPAGWSKDIYPETVVQPWHGEPCKLQELLSSEDDEFRRDVLGEEETEEGDDA